MKNIFRKRAVYTAYFNYSGMRDDEEIKGEGDFSCELLGKIKSVSGLKEIKESIKSEVEKTGLTDVTIVLRSITRLD